MLLEKVARNAALACTTEQTRAVEGAEGVGVAVEGELAVEGEQAVAEDTTPTLTPQQIEHQHPG